MRCLLVVVLSILVAAPASAWNRPGHMITASIAYHAMKENSPKSLGRILTTLRKHPDYDSRWLESLNEGSAEDADEVLFMLAARWPDDIRRRKEYDLPAEHYIDVAFIPRGQPAALKAPPIPKDNILVGYRRNIGVCKDSRTVEAAKAVSLCWIMHQIGDVHQPLHTTHLVTVDRPKGDRGGNESFVRVRSDRAAVDLHSMWDGLLTGSDKMRESRNIATELRHRPEFAAAKLPELRRRDTFESWIAEGHEIAKSQVYRNGAVLGGRDKSSAVLLPSDYAKNAKAVAERRVVLAGLRMAKVLADLGGGK